MIKRFKQFRLDKLTLDQLNREFDLVRQFADSVVENAGATGATGATGPTGPAGAAGADKFELPFSMGYRGVGSYIIDYVDGSQDGYFWFTPDTHAETTSIADVFHTAEWRPEKSYAKCCLVLDVNDLNLGVHILSVDVEVVKNSTGTGIGQTGMTSGAYHINTGSVALAMTTGDTIGLRCKVHHNGSYPPSCPGPDSTMVMTAKIILTV